MNEFRLAGPEDEAELRQLSALPVPGRWIDLSYQRQPNYFAGLSSPHDQVLLGRLGGQALAAVAVRSTPQLLVSGRPQRRGYLGGLRVDPRYQGRNLLAEGFALLRRLHEADPVDEYLATIVEGNELARRLLVERARPSWPRFHAAGVLCTLALRTRAGRAESCAEGQALRRVQEWGGNRPFFPSEPLQVEGERRWWLEHQGVVGALRDLSATRQTVVARYRGWLRWLRPFLRLPRTGSAIRGGYAGFWCSDGHRPQAFQGWLRQMLALARRAGLDWLYLGIMESDPYLAVARRFRHRLYRSQVFRVRYQGLPEALPEGAPYLELAWL